MAKLSPREDTEVSLLVFGIKYWLFCSGVFLGQASSLFLLDLVLGRPSPASFMGVLLLGASLGSYQYKSHLADKLTTFVAKEQKDE